MNEADAVEVLVIREATRRRLKCELDQPSLRLVAQVIPATLSPVAERRKLQPLHDQPFLVGARLPPTNPGIGG